MSTVALFYLYLFFFFFALYIFSFVFDNFHLCCIKIRSNIARLVCHTIMVSTSTTRRELYFSAIWELLPFVPICNVMIKDWGGGIILAPFEFVIIERKEDICIWYYIDYNLNDRYLYLSNYYLKLMSWGLQEGHWVRALGTR